MLERPRRLLALIVLFQAACSHAPGPITVSENVVAVQNQTSRDWRNVVVTVNDHFRGGTATLSAGSRMAAPLSQFQTAFGQHYDVARQRVVKVEVTATDSNGEPVKLELDTGRR
jgi:2-phospho-L-lactate guanylyltransferase (CobY/MobA/RfbA family)